MGYRSNVAFVVPEDAPRFEKIESAFETVSTYEGYRIYHAEWVKWYPDFPVVQAVNEYFAKLDNEDRSDEYYFVECGESPEHVEERGQFYDNPFHLGLRREPSYDLFDEGLPKGPFFNKGDKVKLNPEKYPNSDFVAEVLSHGRLDGFLYELKPLRGVCPKGVVIPSNIVLIYENELVRVVD